MENPETLYGLIEPEDRERIAEAEALAIAGRTSFDIEVAMRRRDGELRMAPIAFDPAHRGLAGRVDPVGRHPARHHRAAPVNLELREQRRRGGPGGRGHRPRLLGMGPVGQQL